METCPFEPTESKTLTPKKRQPSNRAAHFIQRKGWSCSEFNRRGKPCQGANCKKYHGKVYCEYHHPQNTELRDSLHRQWAAENEQKKIEKAMGHEVPDVVIVKAEAPPVTNSAILRRYATRCM